MKLQCNGAVPNGRSIKNGFPERRVATSVSQILESYNKEHTQ